MPAGQYAAAPPGVALRCSDAKLGKPVDHFTYCNAEGESLVHVDYYAAPKDAPSITSDGLIVRYSTYDPERGSWGAQRGVPQPTIFYRLNEVVSNPTVPLLICATERDADHLTSLGDEHDPVLCTTWLGPDGRAAQVDVSPLAGRPVLLIATMGSLEACGALGGAMLRAGIKTSIFDPRRVVGLASEWGPRNVASAKEMWHLLGHAVPMTHAPPQPKAARPVGSVSVGPLPLIERWEAWGFDRDGRNKPYQNVANVKKYLTHHPNDYGDVWLDIYRQQIRYGVWDGENREWGDADDAVLQMKLQTEAGLYMVSKNAVHDAVLVHSHEHPIHPYRRERDQMSWDGIDRLNEVFPRGWGTPDDEYHRAAGRCFFVQQANRIMRPGSKADLMFMFEGKTGTFKTTSLCTVFGDENVTQPTSRFGHPNFYQEILGKVVVEIADLHNFRGAGLDGIKADVSRTSDRFRPPYGRFAEDFARQCVFVGTTERSDWNEDPELTARRFPPVECGKIDLEFLRLNRVQLLAEAWARAKKGEPYWDLPTDIAIDMQRQRVADDPSDPRVFAYLRTTRKTTVLEIAEQALNIKDITKIDVRMTARIVKSLRKANWIAKRDSKDRWWEPGPNAEQPNIQGF